jgi:hypothetical protein
MAPRYLAFRLLCVALGVAASDAVAFGAAASDVPAATKQYEVTYTTGSHIAAGSEAPMYVQLNGQYGSTPFLKLGSRFERDTTKTVALYVMETLGPLMGISVKADATPPFDSWNAVNFIDIRAPDGEVAQFKTDFTVSGKPEVKYTDYGIFESFSEIYAHRENFAQQSKTAAKYTVGWQTGTLEGAGSMSRHFVQLIGTRATSRYYSLCPAHTNGRECFVEGAAQLADLHVSEQIGELQRIELVAGGEDGWNVIDYVQVRTPSQQKIQFKADFWLDSADHRAKPLAYGIYPYTKSRQMRAVNAEEPGVLANEEQCPRWIGTLSVGNPAWGEADGKGKDATVCCPRSCGICGGTGCEDRPGGADACCHNSIRESRNMCTIHASPCVVYDRGYKYKVEFTTGSMPHAGTNGRVWVQLNGQRGSTNFEVIQHSGLSRAAKTFIITVNTQYNIGTLTGVTLSSSSDDGWYVAGDINVYDAKYKYSVKADWWLDMQPNNNKESYGGRPHSATKAFRGLIRTSYAAVVSTHGPAFGARKSFGGAGSGHQHTGNTPTVHDGTPAAHGAVASAVAPVASQIVMATESKGQRWCQNGKIRVMEGWKGPGDGHNACNSCSCEVNVAGDAKFSCSTNKSCGVWWRNEFVMGAVVCPADHLSCSYGKGVSDEGTSSGRHRLRVRHTHKGMSLYKQHRCGFDVLAPSKPCTCICFDPIAQSAANRIVGRPETLTMSPGNDVSCKWITFPRPFRPTVSHHAGNVVVSATNADGEVVTSWVQATHEDKFEACVETAADKVDVGYFGFDSRKEEEQLHMGITSFGTHVTQGKTYCKTVMLSKSFTRTPFVSGSIDMFSGEFHDQKEGLPVYHWLQDVYNDRFDVCVLATTELAKDEEMRFTYVAAAVEAPSLTYATPIYSEAGVIDSGVFEGQSCRTHNFARKYNKAPTVLVSGEAYFSAGSSNNDRPLSTYLKQVTGSTFTVCSAAVVSDGTRQVRMHWVAFGTDVKAVAF